MELEYAVAHDSSSAHAAMEAIVSMTVGGRCDQLVPLIWMSNGTFAIPKLLQTQYPGADRTHWRHPVALSCLTSTVASG
jgi:hypothetical protein